ncbi:MAG: signal peptidase II [Phycisphaerae bacterium]|nr:signal peptidase II [Phycisphaerae bacterium]NIP54449.1 signal peptidase II [Phycisphaerae bacterium]NIS53308.1 signal peptidase II [Phycisphaerae bacterium]NIU10834.1 signal peptidase II [Phycisphaerae bacterium]NIU58629.1 signal peptidase II [Phycisphaerae bacterium]
MTEINKEGSARPSSGRAFLSRTEKTPRCTPFWRGITVPPLKAHIIFWSLLVLGFALDLWTKKAVFDFLEHQPNNRYSIINGFLQLVMMENIGAAFGIASGQRYLLAAFSIVALIVIFGIFLYSPTERKLIHVALGLFAAGVCGNLYDRLFNNRGAVRDFIDVVYWPGKHWPAFNVADSLLCIGVGLMIIACIFTDKSPPEHVQQQK